MVLYQQAMQQICTAMFVGLALTIGLQFEEQSGLVCFVWLTGLACCWDIPLPVELQSDVALVYLLYLAGIPLLPQSAV